MEAGRELDALVAEKVMGQTDFKHPGFPWTEWATEDARDGGDGWICPRCGADGLPDRDYVSPVPCVKHYSTDIAAAWQVVEKLKTMKEPGVFSDTFWQFVNYIAVPNWTVHDLMWELSPLTICLAALKVVGIEVPKLS